MNNSEKLTGAPDRNPVDCDSLRTVLFQMHVDLKIDPPFFYNRLNMSLIVSELYQIPVLRSSVRFRRPGQIQGFQYIRLSLGIIPIQDVCGRIKFQIQQIIISVIFQLQRFDYHNVPI